MADTISAAQINNSTASNPNPRRNPSTTSGKARINVLEKILWLHSIDVDTSVAQLIQQNAMPTAPTSFNDISAAAFDQLCDTFEGTLSLHEAQNFDRDVLDDSPKDYSSPNSDLYAQTLSE
ncbi:hypothetical protein GGI43DRAFT_387334 [Trichoderma evansii]